MECNKHNHNIRYAIFRDSNLKKLSEYLVLQSNIFLYFYNRFSKLKRFFSIFGSLFFTFLADLLKRNVVLCWECLYNYSRRTETLVTEFQDKIVVIYRATWRTLRPQPLKIVPKKCLIFFSKKHTLKQFLIFSQKKVFLIFRKQNFLIFRERYIQNLGIFRTRSIFRTLVYLQLKAYSEHCQTSAIERFIKIAT